MNILVLGGSYFLGKHFIDMAKKEHKITVFNRGSRPLMIPDIVEISGERHDGNALLQIPQQHFDAVVDFCAYNKNDIEFIFQNLKATFDQYIFISTCDVYKRGLGKSQSSADIPVRKSCSRRIGRKSIYERRTCHRADGRCDGNSIPCAAG